MTPFEAVFEVMMDEFLERRAPERRAARRAERARDGTCAPPAPAPAGTERSRYIPAALEDEIWIRDGGRCTYVAPDGTRCASIWDLEIHHEEPFARDGKTDAKTCRLRCQVHNLYAARQDFGDEHVDRAIERRRRERQVDMLAPLDERSDQQPSRPSS